MTEKEQMLTAVLDCRRVDLYVDPAPLTRRQRDLYAQMRDRREEGEPLQYIIGHCEFFGMKFFVDSRVLIPRPETEILVETVLKHVRQASSLRSWRVLDLGTGSGNIAVTLAKFIDNCRVRALDVSAAALEVARHNARCHGVEGKMDFVCQDMVEFLREEKTDASLFDIMISNPPYIQRGQIPGLPKEIRREPRLALDGGEDGLDFYKDIIAEAHRFLAKEGLLVMEMGDGQSAEIAEIFKRHPFYTDIHVRKDLGGTDRIITARKGVS